MFFSLGTSVTKFLQLGLHRAFSWQMKSYALVADIATLLALLRKIVYSHALTGLQGLAQVLICISGVLSQVQKW